MTSQGNDVSEVRQRAFEARMKAKTSKHGDHYKVLGLARTCDIDEVRITSIKLKISKQIQDTIVLCQLQNSPQTEIILTAHDYQSSSC